MVTGERSNGLKALIGLLIFISFIDYVKLKNRLFVFLAIIAIFPAIVVKLLGIQQGWALFYGGTSLLIMVGVAIDTIQQVNSYLLNRHYDGLMKSGKVRRTIN